jgi:hypothetical protein
MITYSQVKREVESITSEIATSEQVVPSFWRLISPFKFVYLLTASIMAVCFAVSDGIFVANLMYLGATVIVLFIISAFLSAYTGLYSMLPAESWGKYEILKIIKSKVKVYGAVYCGFILVAGLVGAVNNGFVGLIPITAFVLFPIFLCVFNLDMSRYQLSSLIGVLAAAKSELTK